MNKLAEALSDKHVGLIFGSGPSGRCDDFRVGGAVVDYDCDERLWRMWYYCRDKNFSRPAPPQFGTGRIALATSSDGITWARVDGSDELGAVFSPENDQGKFDTCHIGLTDVTRDENGWRMWYFGADDKVIKTNVDWLGDVVGLGMRCGTANSGDGVVWKRELGPTPSGALFDILEDERYASWPNAITLSNQTLIQYTAPSIDMSDYRTRVVGMSAKGAIERLGALRWVDEAHDYDAGGIVTRHVIPDPRDNKSGWLMAYTALSKDHARSIAFAESVDALHWARLKPSPVLAPGLPGSWDEGGVAVNRVVVQANSLFLYYYGFGSLKNPESTRGIGLAICQGFEAFDFQRLRRKQKMSEE